jgi:osmotically-inducible protein OsmY
MKKITELKVLLTSILLVGGLAACDQPGSAEKAGKEIDQKVEQVGDKISEAGDKVSESIAKKEMESSIVIEDATITGKVKAAILAESGLKTLQISVDTEKGKVSLTGSVDSKEKRDLAQTLAAAVEGVREVDNRLVLKAGK